ncbi:hypothetical protein TWF173_008005 [Orbilia oligospora]|nr:hypothetical protein TWF173_008005 [Orbilia oligospora]
MPQPSSAWAPHNPDCHHQSAYYYFPVQNSENLFGTYSDSPIVLTTTDTIGTLSGCKISKVKARSPPEPMSGHLRFQKISNLHSDHTASSRHGIAKQNSSSEFLFPATAV